MKKWISVFRTYRRVLNGITVHFLPPRIDTQNPTRTTCIDAIMNQLPEGEVRGFVMFFNQTEEKRTEKITLPVGLKCNFNTQKLQLCIFYMAA